MIYMFLAIAVAACFQPTGNRRNIAAIYAVATVGFYFLDPYLGDYQYYMAAGGFDAAIVCLVSMFAMSTFGAYIISLSLFSFVVNFYGLLAYETGLDPYIYNHLLWGVYAIALSLFLFGGPDAWGKSKVYDWLSLVFRAPLADAQGAFKVSREAGN